MRHQNNRPHYYCCISKREEGETSWLSGLQVKGFVIYNPPNQEFILGGPPVDLYVGEKWLETEIHDVELKVPTRAAAPMLS